MCTWEREREGRVVFSKPKAKGEEGKKKHVAWSNNKARESMSHVARRYQITSWPQHPSPHLFLILICSFLSSFLLSRCFSYWYPVIYHKFTAVLHDIILLSYVVNHWILLHHKDQDTSFILENQINTNKTNIYILGFLYIIVLIFLCYLPSSFFFVVGRKVKIFESCIILCLHGSLQKEILQHHNK